MDVLRPQTQLGLLLELSGDPSLASTLRIVSNFCINALGKRSPMDPNAGSIRKLIETVHNSSELNASLTKEIAALKSEIESSRVTKPTSPPQPPEEGLNESQHAPNLSRFTKSDLPIPIKLTTQQPPRAAPKRKS
jgi:hypothetical protein